MDDDRLVGVGYVAAGAISLGSLGPWATAGPVTSSGVDEPYGIYALLLGLFAAFVLYRWAETPKSEWLVGLAILAGICLLFSGWFALAPGSLLDLPRVDPGWGLIVSLAGSATLLAVAGVLYRRNPS
jgi:hypothetical protein